MATFYPPVGTWYKDAETGQLFEVVAIDENYRTIEIQFADGDIAEYDIESWGSLTLTQEAQAPENAYSDYEQNYSSYDGFGDDPEFMFSGNLSPLDSFEPEAFTGFDDLY